MTSTAQADAEPDHDTSDPHEPRRWLARLGRRGRTILITGVIAAVVASTIGMIALVVHLDTTAARAEYLLADEHATRGDARLHTLTTSLDDALDEAHDLALVIDAVLAIDGDGLDPGAHEELRLVRADLELPEPFPAVLARPIATYESHTAAEWRGRTASAREWLATTETRHVETSAAVDETRARVDEMTDALADYTDAVTVAGAALLTDRPDASSDATTGLQAAITALTHATPDDASARLESYVDAAAAVITTSDAARRPSGPTGGEGGSGYRIPDPGSITAVVNKTRSLAAAYAPTDLRRPAGVGNTLPLRDEAATAAERMAADMAQAGITLRMSSGYRSYSRQVTIYSGFVSHEGVAGADAHSARPGHSEHQTGLAADFDDGTGCALKVCFRDRPGSIWLAENAWKYGWILRYGDGWHDTVGYRFEPWHYRYVGVTVAADMHSAGTLTLEEHFGTGAAPNYLG